MAVWAASASVDAPFGKRRLRELSATLIPPDAMPAALPDTLRRITATINESSGVDRVLAVVALATAARHEGARELVLESLEGLEDGLESLLEAREDARVGKEAGAWRRDMHDAVMLLLVRLQGFRLTASQALEFVRGDVGLCTELLARLLAVTAYEDEVCAAASRMLFELTLPSAAVGADASATVTEHSLKLVTSRAGAAAALLVSVSGQPLLEAAVTGLGGRVAACARAGADRPRLFEALRWFCAFVENAWTYAEPGPAAALLGHLRVATPLAGRVLLPALGASTSVLAAPPREDPGADCPLHPKWAGQCAVACCRLLALLAYRASADIATPAALAAVSEAARRLLVGPQACSSRRGLAVVLACVANCGAAAREPLPAGAEADDDARACAQSRHAVFLSVRESVRSGVLASRAAHVGSLLIHGSRSLPVDRDIDAFAAVLSALAEPMQSPDTGADAELDGAVVEEVHAEGSAGGDAGTRSGGGPADLPRPAAFDPPAASEPAASSRAALPEPAVFEAPEEPGPAAKAALPRPRRFDAPAEGRAASADRPLLGSLPALKGRAGATAAPSAGVRADDELDMAAAPMHCRREWTEMRWQAMQADRASREARKVARAVPAPSAATAEPGPATLLSAGSASPVSPSAEAVPSDFACSLDGHAMRDPVRKGGDDGSGPSFDRAAITDWLRQFGEVCPVTGDTLRITDLLPCPGLRAQIQRWRAGLGGSGGSAGFGGKPRGRAVAITGADESALRGDALYEF